MPDGDVDDGGAQVPMIAGDYMVPSSEWSVADFTVTFPDGWAVQYGHLFSRHSELKNQFGFYAVVVDQIYADACQGDAGDVVQLGPGVNDLVDALLEQPGPAKRGPIKTTLGGYPAIRVDLTTPPRLAKRDCFLGPGTGVQIWYSEQTTKYFVLLPGEVVSVYAVDVDGQRQVFLASVGNPRSTRDRAELQTVLDSIRIRSVS